MLLLWASGLLLMALAVGGDCSVPLHTSKQLKRSHKASLAQPVDEDFKPFDPNVHLHAGNKRVCS